VNGPEQCIPAAPGKYKIFGEAFIASADNPGPGTSVLINVLFFKGENCTAPLLGSASTASLTAKDVWTLLSVNADVPAETVSMKVRLGLVKPLNQTSFKATFDNILVAPSP
jgi:hypothetical protein